ncbi:MAG: ATP-dependent Clp protease adaptor protein ClpS [Verrucomicrobiales bacterium]
MPITIDKPGTGTGTDVVIESKTDDELDIPWNVIIYDDPVNYMGFVTLVLRRVFGYSEEKATGMMLEVHEHGKSIVWTGEREKAEFYVQQLQAYQLLAQLHKAE